MSAHQRGWTLVELMVVVLVIAVLATLAYPAMQEVFYAMESRRVEMQMRDMLRLAKVESFTGKYSVLVCSTDSLSGDITEVNCGKTAQGRLVLLKDYNKNAIMDGRDELIYVQDWRIKYGFIRLHAGNRDYVRYYDTGKPRGHFGHLRYCSPSSNPRYSFRVVFNAHGQVTVVRASEREVGCGGF